MPGLAVEGCGGAKMAAAGATLLARVEQLSAIGFLEVVGSIPRHYALLRQLRDLAATDRYDAAVLIDYPGFHLRLGRDLRRLGIPVLWFVAPQLWAWRPGRLAALRRAADGVAAILPFEEQWFRSRGVPARYVGHPLLDRARPGGTASATSLQVVAGQRVLGIFPGSRSGEVGRHWPLFRDAALGLLERGACDTVLAAAVRGQQYPEPGPIRLVYDRPDEVMAVSTAAIIKSGTTTLSAALAGVPAVVVYRATWSTYQIARQLMSVDRISLINLVADRAVVPEIWRPPVSVESIVAEAAPLLDRGSAEHQAQRSGLEQVARALGEPGATDRVAAMVEEYLRQ
jgi:lipid-A-disaccharide synthase